MTNQQTTTFVAAVADAVFKQNLQPALVLSLTMSTQQFIQALLCELAGVPKHKLVRGMATSDDLEKLGSACVTIANAQMFVWSEDMEGVHVLREAMAQYDHNYKLAMIAVQSASEIDINVVESQAMMMDIPFIVDMP
jgi:replicative DNA helicase